MDKIQALKNAIEFAKKNPDTPEAMELRKRIEAGAYSNEMEQIRMESSVAEKQAKLPTAKRGIAGVLSGAKKGFLSGIKGAGQLGETIGHALLPKFAEEPSVYSEEALQADAERGGFLGKNLREENLIAQTPAEKLGKFGEQVAEFAIPATKVSKLSKGANFLRKVGTRALGSGTVATVQSGKVDKNTAIASGAEVLLPVAGKIVSPAVKLVGRLFKGLGSAVSGASVDMLEQIARNPDIAKQTVKQIESKGALGVLEDNARQIVEGVSTIEKQARQAYGDALENLAKEDIKPSLFRSKLQPILDKFGSITEGNTRLLDSVEFENPLSLRKASQIIDKITNTELNGKDINKTLQFIKSKKYTTATGDERLAFNAFAQELYDGLRTAVNESTDKLAEMNAKYSTDLGLSGAIEKIFGQVNFKNPSELNAVAQKLEALFNQKGLSPKYVDDFLTRIGISPEDFKTSEATRQLSTKKLGVNKIGVGFGEGIATITSAGITPKLVRDIAIATGKSERLIRSMLEKTSPSARALLIKTLMGNQ